MVLPAAQRAQCRQVLLPDLVLVALHEAQQRLVPHHRHLPLVVRKAHKVVHLGVKAGRQGVSVSGRQGSRVSVFFVVRLGARAGRKQGGQGGRGAFFGGAGICRSSSAERIQWSVWRKGESTK